MTDRPLLLDLFCGAGGAAMGYHRAGFDVVGVDIEPQPNYPFRFIQGNAIDFPLDGFDAVHASPPCQRYSNAQRLRGRSHPDLIEPTRRRLDHAGVPYVIENVVGAPLLDPVTLCGVMFEGLAVYRHRLFEASFPVGVPIHGPHEATLATMGRPPSPGEFMHVVGNFSGAALARQAMGIDWMTRDEIRESIPPAYTEHIGRQLLNVSSGPYTAESDDG